MEASTFSPARTHRDRTGAANGTATNGSATNGTATDNADVASGGQSAEDSLKTCPRISAEAHTISQNQKRTAENIPVIEGDDTLASMVQGGNRQNSFYMVESRFFSPVAVIAGSEQAALGYLADFGVLDGVSVTREEARRSDRSFVRLGNAGEPFDLQMAGMVVSTFTTNHIIHFRSQLRFGSREWLHCWSKGLGEEEPPYQDLIVRLGEGFEVVEMIVPNGMTMPKNEWEFARQLAQKECRDLMQAHR